MIRSVDWVGMLEHETGRKWVDADGPDSGVGVDYWYAVADTDDFALVNIDQDHVSVSLHPGDLDEESRTIFEGSFDDLMEDMEFCRFITSSPVPA